MQLTVRNGTEKLVEACRQHNLRITPQRLAVYQELIRSKNSHPSAEQIYEGVKKSMPHISFDTVNRTLLKLAEVGLVDVFKGIVGPRRFDPSLDSHHHFFCLHCEKVIDFSTDKEYELSIPSTIADNNIVLSRSIVLSGFCQKCRQGQKSAGHLQLNTNQQKEQRHE